ncbi:hypothetical protein QNA08_15275, partial [Chelatococcus sp. SYSU_G07232]
RFTRPAGHNQCRKRTQNWIELGGNVNVTGATSVAAENKKAASKLPAASLPFGDGYSWRHRV